MANEIKGVEVFSVGKWNGNTFQQADLDKMVEAFNKTQANVRPFLKLGHAEEQKLLQAEGLPAAGWVGNLYRKGDKLLADFVDIPKKISELIFKKAYRKVSIELFRNVEILEEKFDFLIGAVALLGAETPGVMNLNDILAQYKLKGYDSLEQYTHECGDLVVKRNFTNHGGQMDKDLIAAKAEVENLKKDLEKAKKESEKFQADLKNKDQANEDLQEKIKQANEKYTNAAAELKKAKIEGQVAELEKEGLITPAMKPFAAQILDEDCEKFTIKKDKEEKEATRFEVVKHLFSLAKGADVNLEEDSDDTDGLAHKKDYDKIDAEIDKYAKENKVSYGEAYSVVTEKYQKELQAAQ